MLSLLLTHSPTGRVAGMKEFPRDDQPPVWLPFVAFRVMLLLGFGFFALTAVTLWVWYRGGLAPGSVSSWKWLLYAWMAALPASYIAMESGWIVREVGRQPWTIYGLVRTVDSPSLLPLAAVEASLFFFVAVYSVLLILFLVFARILIARGPDIRLPNETPLSAPHGIGKGE
jgi:cytochrome d ubiquinol oxidase subunit I